MAEEKTIMELDQYAKVKGRFSTTKFSESPNPLLICQLCQAVMNYPHQLVAGKKSVKRGCYACLQEIIQDGQRLEPVTVLEEFIAVLEISCQRCDDTVEIGDLYRHDRDDCPEVEIECDVCDIFLKKAGLEAHQFTQEHTIAMLNRKLDELATGIADDMTDLKSTCKSQQHELIMLQSLCQTQEKTLTELRSMLTEKEEEEEEKKDDFDEKLVWSCYSFPSAGNQYLNSHNVTDPADCIILPKMTNIAYVKTNCIKNSVVAYSFMLHQSPVQYTRAMGLLKAESIMPTHAEFINRELLIARFGIDAAGSLADLMPDDASKAGFISFKLAQNINKEVTENEMLKREVNKKTKVTYLIDSRKLANVKIAIYLNDTYTGLKYSVNCENSVLVPYLFAINGTDTICPIATIIGYEPFVKVRELLAEFMADYAPII